MTQTKPRGERHPLAHLPTTRRIDVTLAILRARGLTPDGGWTIAELADLCGCSRGAIFERQKSALKKLRQNPELKQLLKDLKP
ncbi:MAG: sigma factor-like helix-turn-helix DNA-binding protein [Verrucomicrobiales bacterium]